MAAEGKRSKGRFQYLFDWNAKSRKKLFSNKSSESFDAEGSSQGKESVESLPISQYLLKELSENGERSSFRGSGNYSCVSSISGDDVYGTKAPGVVARLMGLDSMPTTTSCETGSFASYESLAVGSSYYPRGAAPFDVEHHIGHHGYNYAPNKVEGFPRTSGGPRMNKAPGRPIERFQTEVLPPKSAKSISATHHKLLSPIKSPGFIPTKDAAYIMEAAARIIDPAPPSSGRTKMPSLGSPSSSFKYHDLKDKYDAAQRSSRLSGSSKTPKLSAPVQEVRGTTSDRASRRSLFKNIISSQTNNSSKVKHKGKTVPSVAQDKVTVQKKGGLGYSDSRSQQKKDRRKLNQKEPRTQKTAPNTTPRKKGSGVLRQNNEKQNSISHKDHLTTKTSASDQQQRRKISSGDNCAGPSKIVSKVFVNAENRPNKVATTSVTDRRPPLNGVTDKRASLNRMKNISKGKQCSAKDNRSGDQLQENGDESFVRRDQSLQGTSGKDMDVISFTFTSPIKKAGTQSLSTTTGTFRSNHTHLCADSFDNDQSDTSSPPRGFKLIDNSSISLLLEQKLRELTDKIGSTKPDSVMEDPDRNDLFCESIASHDVVAPSSMDYDDWSDKDQTSATCDDDCSSSLITKSSQNWEDFEGFEEQSSSSTSRFEACEESHLKHLNTMIPECSMSGSLMSSTAGSDVTHGNGQPSSPQSQEVTSCVSNESVQRREDESDFTDASYWELEYVRYVLHYAGLGRLRLDEDCENIDPGLYDLLENLINSSGRNAEPCSKLDRKILFDCVTESVNAKFQRTFLGSYKSWAKWEMMLQNEWLTEEVYKEILCWQHMGSLMVDELVDREMSTQYGKWLDFEIESLEEGVEIEQEIVASLVDELVVDLIV